MGRGRGYRFTQLRVDGEFIDVTDGEVRVYFDGAHHSWDAIAILGALPKIGETVALEFINERQPYVLSGAGIVVELNDSNVRIRGTGELTGLPE